MSDQAILTPVEEPTGYQSAPGFVKSRPENNDHYVEQWADDDWYEIIAWLHKELNSLIPGYNISQIKAKFGGLRYYFQYPEVIPIKEEWPAYNSVEKIKAMVEKRVSFAEGWVEGFEASKRKMSS